MITIHKNVNGVQVFNKNIENKAGSIINYFCKLLFSFSIIFFSIVSGRDALAVNYHIAVNGNSNGDGSASKPWDLVTGLSGSKGAPGDTLWLRGGVYKGHFVSRLRGNASANIVVAQYPGETAIIDGSIGISNKVTLNIYGSYTTFYGFQVINSDNKRISNYSGGTPSDIITNTGIHVDGPYIKLINLIVRDVIGVGIGFWKAGIDSELYGNIVYNNGWQGSDRGHGHGIYSQNETGTKHIRDNILFGGFGRGIQIYGVNGGLKGFNIDGNVIFNSGALSKSASWNIIIGGETMADDILLKNNFTYKSLAISGLNVQVHFSNTLNGKLAIHNNLFVGGDAILSIRNWQSVAFSGNTIYGRNRILNLNVGTEYLSSYKWNNNTYLTPNTTNAMNGMTFDNWKKAYNFDANSRLSTATPSNEIIVKPNIYEKGTGSVVVFNHQGLTSVDVDLSKILAVGAEFEIRDVENLSGLPIITGKYNGGTLRLPMNLTTTDKPNGISKVEHSDSGIGVFLVRTTSKTSSAVIANNPPTLNVISNPAAINEDALSQTVNLSGITAGAGESQTLKVTATSDNITLIPNITVIYTSPNTSGTLVYQPAANRWGTANITVRVDDGAATNNTITRTFQVTVNPINDAPTLNALSNLNIPGNSSTQTVNLSGITAGPFESQRLVVTATSNNTALIPNPTVTYTSPNATGSIKFAPLANQSGTATITVRVTDDGSGTAPHVNTFIRSFTVTVGAITYVNKPPTLNIINNAAAINEDAPEQTINLSGITAGEGESQKLSITATSDNTTLIPGVTVQYTSPNNTGSLKYKPAANRSGTAKITVVVNDGAAENNSISRTFTVTVNEVNDAPNINAIANISLASNALAQSVSLLGINAGPFESQVISINATSSNTALIPNPTIIYTSPSTTGTLNFTPAANQSGTAIITVQVTDNGPGTSPHVNTVTKNFTVTVVEAVNKQPTLNAINNPADINEDATEQVIQITGITAGEGETQNLIVTATSDNTTLIPHPKVTYTSPNATGSISYKPAANRSGVANITVKVDDGGKSNNIITRTFSVKVNPVNDAPNLNAIANISLDINAATQTVNLSGINSGPFENQTLTIVATSNNTALIPNPVIEYTSPNNTGKLIFKPVANQKGTATITVRITDNGSNIAPHVNTFTRTFTVVITGSVSTLMPPTINKINDINNILEDATLQTVPLSGISAGTGDSKLLKITASSNRTGIIPNPTVEYIAPNNHAVLNFKPLANKFGLVTITVKVENGSATHHTTTTSFNVNVLPVNDAPTLNALNNLNILTNSPLHTVNLSGITAGPGENQTLSVSVKSSNTTLFSSLSVVYTSPNNTGSIRLQPATNASGSSTITVRVTDNGSNIAPHKNFIERSFTVNVTSLVTEPEVISFNLINTQNGQVITDLKNGSILYMSKLPPLHNLNIDALVNQQINGSMVFGFNNNTRYSIENFAAYAIAGNTGTRYHNWNNGLIPGKNTISATIYSEKGGVGTKGKTSTITITVIDDLVSNLNNAKISNLLLVNAENEEVVLELYDNMVIDVKELPVTLDQLNIKAVLSSESTGSVVFGLNENPRYNVENKPPFLMGGNTLNKSSNWSGLDLGKHSITATTYRSPDGSGEAISSYTINFNIKNTLNLSRSRPTVISITRNFPKNQNYQFIKEDFKTAFVDEKGTKLVKVKIETLPSFGMLILKNKEVAVGEEITTENIKKLVYIPNNKEIKEDSFTWNGSNGVFYAEEVAYMKLTAVEETIEKVKFELAKFWPNPAQDYITVNFTAPSDNSVKIYINDITGQIVKTYTSNIHSGKNELMLNVEDLKGGVYTVTLVNQFDNITFKMIKNK